MKIYKLNLTSLTMDIIINPEICNNYMLQNIKNIFIENNYDIVNIKVKENKGKKYIKKFIFLLVDIIQKIHG